VSGGSSQPARSAGGAGAGGTLLLRHAKVTLALHPLREAREPDARPLLLLHGRGQATRPHDAAAAGAWPGAILGLDFTGHGASTLPRGGGYTAEILMADADAALARLGPATVLGRGLGAYVALLLAGGRPELVRGAILCDGPGLAGGGARPTTPSIPWPPERSDGGAPDPFALVDLARDVRPPNYATSFARLASQLSGLERPISVCSIERPDWLRAVLEEPGVAETTLAEALAHYARAEAGGPARSAPQAGGAQPPGLR
jgi:pimeloyl-ACP methyl ester carboxylesterase